MRIYYLALCMLLCSGTQVLWATGDTLSVTPDYLYTGLTSDGFASGTAWVDVNGDGFDDLVIGASGMDHEILGQGEVQVYFSDGTSLPSVPDQILIESTDFERFGGSVYNAGDINNDGYEDLIATGIGNDFGFYGGNIMLYFGSPTGLSTTYAWRLEVTEYSYSVIIRCFSGFDVNLDGYDDVIIGDIYSSEVHVNSGSARLYLGSATGLATIESWSAFGETSNEYYGSAISVADANDDGWPDIVSAEEGINYGVGRIEMYLGGPTGFSSTPSFEKFEAYDGEEFGAKVNITKDLNNDSYVDMVVSVGNRINGEYTNALDIFYGPFLTEFGSADTSLYYAAYNSAYFGNFDVQDITGDGYPDLLVYAKWLNSSHSDLVAISNTADGFSPLPVWVAEINTTFGFGFSAAGDYNGDGLKDILASYGPSAFAKIFTGKHNFPGLPPYAITFTTGYQKDYEYYGSAISASGDINNDGINDMITGSGIKTYYYSGRSPEMDANHKWSYDLYQPGSELGKSLKIVSDFNSDGFDDIIVGAPDYDYAATSDGFVALFKGKSTGLFTTPAWVKTGSETDYQFGFAVNSGDFNGDGKTDFIIGSPGGTGYISRAYIYLGNGGIPDGTVDYTFKHDGQLGFGYRIATGDVNGDGYTDALITEDYGGVSHNAKVWLYYGGNVMDTTADWSFIPAVSTQDFGEWISMDADYNDDGINDIVIGNPSYTNGQTTEGCIYVFYGSITGPASVPDLLYESNIALLKLGTSFVGGDLNGDGFDDLALGMPEYDLPTNNGVVRILYGKAGGISTLNYSDIVGGGSTFHGRTLSYSPDADGDNIGDLFVGHWYTGTSSRGNIQMYKGKLDLCSLYTDTSLVTVTDTTVSVYWNDVAAVNYNIRLRKAGTVGWTTITTTGTYAQFTELDSCTLYELQLNAECDASSGAWHTFYVSTVGCPLPCNLVEIPSVTISGITGSTATVTWEEPEEALSYIVRFKQVSAATWIEFELPVNSIVLATLTACTNYEVQIKSDCGVDTSYWSDSYLFTTTCGGCGTAPAGLYESPITATGAKLHWIADPGASKYKVYYRQTGTATWIIVNAHQNFRTLTGLLPSTTYEYKVKSLCAVGVESGFSVTETFTTLPFREGITETVSMTISPSPNNGTFRVNYDGFTTPPNIRIYTIGGQLVYEASALDLTETTIELPHVEPGLYLIELNNGTSSMIEKFIVTY